eukprot:gene8035-8863_t
MTTCYVAVQNESDWPGPNRPDRNLQNTRIEKKSYIERPAEYNAIVATGFQISVKLENNSEIGFVGQVNTMTYKRVSSFSDGYLILEDTLAGYTRITIISCNQWIGDNIDMLGDRTLRSICLPGTHDAAIYTVDQIYPASMNLTSITQKMTILEQLTMGIRYFDLRVTKRNDLYYATNYYTLCVQFGSLSGCAELGGRGPTIDAIIDEFNTFTTNYHKEVIILNFSQSTGEDGQPFDSDTWVGLLTKLRDKVLCLYTNDVPDLTQVKLKDFVASGQSAVIVVVRENPAAVNWSDFHGIHQGGKFPMFNESSNTQVVDDMTADQINKMIKHKKNPDDPVFLLSWTLTQSTQLLEQYARDIAQAIAHGESPPSPAGGKYFEYTLENLAAQANSRLNCIFPACDPHSFPNIIMLDFVFPDLPILPICHDINNLVIVNVFTLASFRIHNKKREEDNCAYLTLNTQGSSYLDMSPSRYTADAKWIMTPTPNTPGQPQFRLINVGNFLPISATEGPYCFLKMEETHSTYSVWRIQYIPTDNLFSYSYESPTLLFLNEYYVLDKNTRIYMDANTGREPPYLKDCPDSPYIIWRLDKPNET